MWGADVYDRAAIHDLRGELLPALEPVLALVGQISGATARRSVERASTPYVTRSRAGWSV